MWLFGRVERLQQRLRVMIFIGNFQDHCRTIGPQLKVDKISKNRKKYVNLLLRLLYLPQCQFEILIS